MKRVLLILLIIISIIGTIGFWIWHEKEINALKMPDTYDTILNRGYVIAGVKTDTKPFGYKNEKDEIIGLDIARLYGAIGQTNFGDIDVNKPGVVARLNEDGKSGSASCHTFLDDIVGAIAAAASTRVAQIWSEDEAARRNNN